MELNSTLQGDRIHIAILGRRNVGKSSVINAITGQDIAIVSDVKGTTTDPVSKAMEILPLGACLLTDTPGLDDYGELGAKRVGKTLKVLDKTDIALVVADISSLTCRDLNSRYGMAPDEEQLVSLIEEKKLPYIIVLNQTDRLDLEKTEEIRGIIASKNPGIPVKLISTMEKTGIEELKDAIALLVPEPSAKLDITGDLASENDIAVLVTPIDSSAPKGRLIMPQQQVIRDLLDNGAVAVVTQVPGLKGVLERLGDSVKIVITDSQAFKEVAALVPDDIPLTSFSILFARHKGNLKKLAEGAAAVDNLKDGDKVLIAEGCTHRRQCEDIGTVKIPRWLKECSGKELVIETCSGSDFPQDLSGYALIIHCGGCTLTERVMKHRILCASGQGVPIVNYGIFIAYVNGILKRSVNMFPSVSKVFMDNKE
ncbi:MAG: [FeFe] hydrogenase H-cluster maturation GTPase HydF [Lachnospiraceae bacterium]|nr:[FeFe] hydrogenase H-cluster maturation GTPase HydF [Lachnospiraceae bacterium]